MVEILPLPAPPEGREPLNEATKTWVEEAIWGHRLRKDQEPWQILLEFLNLCHAASTKGGVSLLDHPEIATDPPRHEQFGYGLPVREVLRYIIFRDRHVTAIQNSADFATDQSRWQAWREAVTNDLARKGITHDHLLQLERNFQGNFVNFAHAVQLLRAMEIEPERGRRWTSRHLTPHGPALFYADVKESSGKGYSNDRRFFARGGELLYLMLHRSRGIDVLRPLIAGKLLADGSRWNTLAGLFQPLEMVERPIHSHSLGYLPAAQHRTYDRLAEDWIALLSIKKLPIDHLFDPLVRITGLGIVRYLLDRAQDQLQLRRPHPLLLDFTGGRARGMRKASAEQHHIARHLTTRALEAFIFERLAGATDPAWPAPGATSGQDRSEAQTVLRTLFLHEQNYPSGLPAPEQQLADFKEYVLAKHEAHLGLVQGIFAQKIGLATTRQGVGTWYAASDSFVQALLLANVETTMELRVLLDTLYRRYAIVIAAAQARDAFDTLPLPVERLNENERQFEQRLKALGLLKRLSDDCAFVANPFN